MSYTLPKDFVGVRVRVFLNCPMVIKDQIVFPSQDATIKRVIPGALVLVSSEDGEEFVMGMDRVHRVAKWREPVAQLVVEDDGQGGSGLVRRLPTKKAAEG